MTGVFQGLKVIDSATFVPGPAAAVILADFGADVVKVEPVGAGDPQRVLGRLPNLPKADHNYAWTIAARSKRTLGVGPQERDWSNHIAAARTLCRCFHYQPVSRLPALGSGSAMSSFRRSIRVSSMRRSPATGRQAPKLKDRDSMPTPIGLDRDWPTTCDPTARVLPRHLLWGWAISQRPSPSTQGSSRRFFTGSARAWEAASRLRCLPTEPGRMRHRSRRSCAVARSNTACRGRRPGTL